MASETESASSRPSSPTDESPSEAVIRAVAVASGESPLEMDPLYPAVDPDALNALCGDSTTGPRGDGVTVEFEFNGHRVRVSSGGEVRILGRE